MITFTPDETVLIGRLSVSGGWKHREANALKKKIKAYLMGKTNRRCCYCRRSMHEWHGLSIDVEHVLPKGKFPQHTFAMPNLSISCKRCNMGIKGEKTSFYTAPPHAPHFVSGHYEIIHPNLDNPKVHLLFAGTQIEDDSIIKYRVVNSSSKGQATYEIFKLKEIEVNSLDKAQGLSAVAPDLTGALLKLLDELLDAQASLAS